ncbi:MAG: hypothetical protein IKE94_09555 [Aeriscardovia sp.]|nr:hypothetical protein [Aeriscardovia sp.]
MRGTIKGISGNHIWIETARTVILPIGSDVDIDIKEHKDRRSLNANAYFHKLVDELRQKLRISFAACKNQLITSYGQIEYIGDVPATIKTNIEPEKMREQETLHCMPISVADEDGVFWYRVYRGTHTYDTKEMSILIDGTIEECKAQGIETMTSNELERLKGYERHR